MLIVQETMFNKNREMHRILDDNDLISSPVYKKIFPELYLEIKSQFETANNHWYCLSDEAYKQYRQHHFGIVD